MPANYYLSGFTNPLLPVISIKQPELITAFNWGLVPNFCKTTKEAKDMSLKTLNAKSETVFTLPSFKNSIENFMYKKKNVDCKIKKLYCVFRLQFVHIKNLI